MIELHAWYTQNARKVAVALEECGLEWQLKCVNLMAGEQRGPAYLQLNPNGKIPTLVDHIPGQESVALWESGAILIYLAEKSGCLLPADGRSRAHVLQWLAWQVSGLGPTLGQMGHFMSAGLPPDTPGLNPFLALTRAAEAHPYPTKRFHSEACRLIAVLNDHLRSRVYVAGEYSIADIAIHAWIVSAWELISLGGLGDYDAMMSLRHWKARIDGRPAVVRALERMVPPDGLT